MGGGDPYDLDGFFARPDAPPPQPKPFERRRRPRKPPPAGGPAPPEAPGAGGGGAAGPAGQAGRRTPRPKTPNSSQEDQGPRARDPPATSPPGPGPAGPGPASGARKRVKFSHNVPRAGGGGRAASVWGSQEAAEVGGGGPAGPGGGRAGSSHWVTKAARRASLDRPEGNAVASASTLHEVQESGEAMCFMDDAEFALDGVKAHLGAAVRCRNATKLAELCFSRRGVRLLKSQGLARPFLEAAVSLAAGEGPALKAAAAVMLYALGVACEDASSANSVGSLNALADLAGRFGDAEPAAFEWPGCRDVEGRLLKLAKGPLVKVPLPPGATVAQVPRCLALLTLEAATDATSSAAAALLAGEIKGKLGTSKALGRAVQYLADALLHLREAGAEGGTEGKAAEAADGVARWQVQRCLNFLEHATFLHGDNARAISALGLVGGGTVVDELVACCERAGPGDPTFKGVLLLLLNLTHESVEACSAIVASGGLRVIVERSLDFIGKLGMLAPAEGGALDSYEELNLLFGLLINVAEKDAKLRDVLKDEARSVESAFAVGGAPCTFLKVLCLLMAGGPQRGEEDGEDVTAAMLNFSEKDSEAKINQAYTSILLGFIVSEDAALRAAVAALLPEGTLGQLVETLEKFIRFLDSVHAVTEKQSKTLGQLLSTLKLHL